MQTLELGWCFVAKGGMPPPLIVKDLNVLENALPCCLASCVTNTIHQFDLQRTMPTLDHRVVVTVPGAAHARNHLRLTQQRLVAATRILAPTIAVMQKTRTRTTTRDRHAKCRKRQVLIYPMAHRPTNDPTTEHVHDRRQVQPAFARPDIRDVADPEAVRLTTAKVPVQKVGSKGVSVCRIRCEHSPFRWHSSL